MNHGSSSIKISVIILTYNSAKHIGSLLESIISKYSTALKSKKMEIIVADNHSQDDTLRKVDKYKDNVTVIENGGNYGFAKGNNLATKKANGEFLIFINPDAVFSSGDIFSFLEVFNEKKVGIVGGKVISWDGRRELSCGKFYTPLNTFLLSLGLEELMRVRFSPDKKREVPFVSGALLAIRRKLFEDLGGFDEGYFMYIEDSDLCFRARKMGFKTVYSPTSTIRHMGQGSSNRTFAVVNISKGIMRFNRRRLGIVPFLIVTVLLKGKAAALVLAGKIMNNKYLLDTYSKVLAG